MPTEARIKQLPRRREVLPELDRLAEPYLGERQTVADFLAERKRWPGDFDTRLRAHLVARGWRQDGHFFRKGGERRGVQRAAEAERAWQWSAVIDELDEAERAPLLAHWARGEDASVAAVVAEYPGTPEHALRLLVRRGDRAITTLVARHPNAPADLLRTLLGLDGGCYRDSLAENLSLPVELADALLGGSDSMQEYRLLRLLVGNDGLPLDWRLRYLRAEIEAIEPGARRLCNYVATETGDEKMMEFLLDQADDEEIVEHLAMNKRLPDRIVRQLIDLGGGYVLGSLYWNPAVRERFSRELGGDVIAAFPNGRVLWGPDGRRDLDRFDPGWPCLVARRPDGDLEVAFDFDVRRSEETRFWVEWRFPPDSEHLLRPKAWGRRSSTKRDWTDYMRAAARKLLDEFDELETAARRANPRYALHAILKRHERELDAALAEAVEDGLTPAEISRLYGIKAAEVRERVKRAAEPGRRRR